MSELIAIEPITKTLVVACDLEEAFRVFTEEIGSWWPSHTHAVHAGSVRKVVFEQHAGGELYEIAESGEKAHWAQVLVWEPPRCLVLAWQVNPETPAPTEIEVRFVREGADTRVELEHRGWERLGEELGRAGREGYDGGWTTVLGYYEQRLAGD